jgi:ABC-type proline/glycine betaine transport system permease subunit
MKKTRIWKTLALVGVCSFVAVTYGIKYGWLAANTQWRVERLKERPYL